MRRVVVSQSCGSSASSRVGRQAGTPEQQAPREVRPTEGPAGCRHQNDFEQQRIQGESRNTGDGPRESLDQPRLLETKDDTDGDEHQCVERTLVHRKQSAVPTDQRGKRRGADAEV